MFNSIDVVEARNYLINGIIMAFVPKTMVEKRTKNVYVY